MEEILLLPQFQSTVEIHWALIIAGESVGSAVCFKNPWCQSLIFLGEPLISCIVPGNHGLFSGQQKDLPNCGPPYTRISAECSTPGSCPTEVPACTPCYPAHTHTHTYGGGGIMHEASVHHISLELPLWCDTVCVCFVFIFYFFSPFLFFYPRSWASVMKGSVLTQDKEIMCWPLEDYKTMLLLMSYGLDFWGLFTFHKAVGGVIELQHWRLTGDATSW